MFCSTIWFQLSKQFWTCSRYPSSRSWQVMNSARCQTCLWPSTLCACFLSRRYSWRLATRSQLKKQRSSKSLTKSKEKSPSPSRLLLLKESTKSEIKKLRLRIRCFMALLLLQWNVYMRKEQEILLPFQNHRCQMHWETFWLLETKAKTSSSQS